MAAVGKGDRCADRLGVIVLAFGGVEPSADDFIDCDLFAPHLHTFGMPQRLSPVAFTIRSFQLSTRCQSPLSFEEAPDMCMATRRNVGYLLESLRLRGRALHPSSGMDELLDEPVEFESAKSCARARRRFLVKTMRSMGT